MILPDYQKIQGSFTAEARHRHLTFALPRNFACSLSAEEHVRINVLAPSLIPNKAFNMGRNGNILNLQKMKNLVDLSLKKKPHFSQTWNRN